MIDVSEVFDDLNTETLTVIRTTGTTEIIDFELVESTTTESFTITASVQQTNPKDLNFLETGYNVNDYRTIYSAFGFRMASTANSLAADIITYEGADFEIISVSNRQNAGFTKAIMVVANA